MWSFRKMRPRKRTASLSLPSKCARAFRSAVLSAPRQRRLNALDIHRRVQLPMFNERFVAEGVIDAAVRLQWPRQKLHIQV